METLTNHIQYQLRAGVRNWLRELLATSVEQHTVVLFLVHTINLQNEKRSYIIFKVINPFDIYFYMGGP